MVSDKIFFYVFPIEAYVKHLTPQPGHFWSQGYNLNKLGRGLLGDAKYKGSMPCSFRQDFFHIFPIISLCKTCDPWGRAILGPRSFI